MRDFTSILTGHPELQRKSILALGEARCTEAAPFLKKLLLTQTGRIRDAAALSLSEMGAHDAVPLIMELVLHPDNATSRGSLLFSLWKLECIDYFPDFVAIICDGNYESRHTALELLQKYRQAIAPAVRRRALDMLRAKRIVAEVQGDEKEVVFVEYVEGLLREAD